MNKMVFNDDLLVEILARLPIKSLARFKCVSRSWRALISGDYLRRKLPLLAAGLFVHVSHDGGGGRDNNKPRYATVCSGGLDYSDMSFFPFEATVKLVDACNGLLLYRSLATPSAFYAANPTTRRWAALPSPRREPQLAMLAFDPCNSSHYYVVCFVTWQEHGATVEVFSSSAGAWAERDAQFGVEASSLSATAHFRSGVLHVLAYPDRVVCMDIATMAPRRLVQLPEEVDAGARLGHCRGRLYYAKNDCKRLKLWVLDDSGSWQRSLTHAVCVNEMIGNGGCGASEVKFLALHPEMVDVVYLWSPGKLVCCDLRKKEVLSAWEFGAEKEGEDAAHVVRFWLLASSSSLLNCLGDD